MKRWIVAWLIGSLLGLGALFGIGCALGANICGSNPSAGITDGARLFQINCVACHGPDARGGRFRGIAGPSLIDGPASSLSLQQLEGKIAKGGGSFKGMPAFALVKPGLSAQQIEAVARYLIALRGGDR